MQICLDEARKALNVRGCAEVFACSRTIPCVRVHGLLDALLVPIEAHCNSNDGFRYTNDEKG